MACAPAQKIYALNNPLYCKALKLESGHLLSAVIIINGVETPSKQLNLIPILGNIEGAFQWGFTDFFASAERKSITLDGCILKAELLKKDSKTDYKQAQVDLSAKIFIVGGDLVYHANGATVTPPAFTQSGFMTDPARDGNVEARAFAVASDVSDDRAVIAYKTQVDDKVSFAEVALHKGAWGPSKEIDIYQNVVPGFRFAITYDPTVTEKRHLFFSEEDGDGYVYIQSFDPEAGEWKKPERIRGLDGSEGQVKAHRFSGFAATFIKGVPDDVILLYFVDESSALLEYVGKKYFEGYRFYRTETLEQDLVLKSSISAIHKDGKSYVTFRNAQKDLTLAVGKSRAKMPDQPANQRQKIVRQNKAGQASWDHHIIRTKTQLVKNSPLSIALKGDNPVIFYLNRHAKTESIYSIETPLKSTTPFTDLSPNGVSKLEPGSNIAAATLSTNSDFNKHAIRLYSVSKLDGDNILMERIQIPSRGTQIPSQGWMLNGGVVDTDVDHIQTVRSESDE